MDFGEFIAAFGTGYRKLPDTENNKAITKPTFCRELLCSITKDTNIVLYIDGIQDMKHKRSEPAFQAFYRNGERRSLHPIAEKIINSNSLDTSKFIHLLEKYCKEYDKEILLTNFKKYLPSVSSDTLFDGITNEFVRILEEAATEQDKRRKEPIHNKPDSHNDEINDSIEAKIEELLQSMIRKGRKIAEFKRTGVADMVRYSRLKNSLHKDFEQLTLLSDSLTKFNETDYSPIVEDIIDSIISLDESCFILRTEEYMIESFKNFHIHRLSKLLKQLHEEH